MKRLILALVILVLLTTGYSEAFTMRTQPMGWNGWVWGTSLKDVIGWLSYSGNFEIPQKSFSGDIAIPQLADTKAKIYIRQGEPKNYFSEKSIYWAEIYYVFVEEKLQAVLLVGKDAEPAVKADVYYGLDALTYWGPNGEKKQGPIRDGSLRRYEYIFGEGELASYIRMTYPLGVLTDHFYVVVGASPIVKGWIEVLRGTLN